MNLFAEFREYLRHEGNNSKMRIGHGFDSHAWEVKKTKPLILGGTTFKSEYSLKGHSDSDVVVHACIDALLAPTGLGDIGMLFPDSDPKNENADSIEMLREVIAKITDLGWEVINIDCSVIAEKPNISKHKKEIENRISEIISAPFSIKGKHPEGLEQMNGIACFAVSLISEFTPITGRGRSVFRNVIGSLRDHIRRNVRLR